MSDGVWLEAAIRVRYKADPKDYGTNSPSEMAEIDWVNFNNNPAEIFELDDYPKLTVIPVEGRNEF